MQSLKGLALLLAFVFLLSAVATPYNMAFAQPENGQAVKAEMLVKIAERAKNRASEMLETLGDRVPEEARAAFEAGVKALDEAKALKDAGSHQDACRKAVEAMRSFKKTIITILRVVPEEAKPVKPAEEEAEKAIGLRVAISRAEKFIERIEKLAGKAIEEGYEVPEGVTAKLEEARTRLDSAGEALDAGDIDVAARELAEARKLAGQAMGELHSTIRIMMGERLERFTAKAEIRLQTVKEKMEKLAEKLPPEARQKVLKHLKAAEERLKEAKHRILTAEPIQAIKILRHMRAELAESLKTSKEYRGEAAELIGEASKIKGQIAALQAQASALETMGIDVSEVKDRLSKAESLLKQAWKRGLEEARSAIDQAEELVEEAGDLLEELREQAHEKVEKEKEKITAGFKGRLAKLEEKLSQLEEKGAPTVRAVKALEKARILVERAEELAEQGLIVAAERALERAEWLLAKTEKLVASTQQRLEALEEKLEELKTELGEVKAAFNKIKGEGGQPTLTILESLISKAEKWLGKAEAELAEGNLTYATTHLKSASNTLAKVEKLLETVKEVLEETEASTVPEAASNLKDRVNQLLSRVEQLKSKAEELNEYHKRLALEALKGAGKQLSEAEQLLEEGWLKRALERVKLAERLISRAEETVSQASEALEEVQTKLSELKAKIEELKAEGVDVSLAEELLEKARKHIDAGCFKCAEAMFERVEKLIETLTATTGYQYHLEILLDHGKTTFRQGETIKITVINKGTAPLTLPNTAPWIIQKGTRIIYTPVAAQVLVKLSPGDSKTWTWNQKDMDGRQVPPGTYQLTVQTIELKGSVSFTIVEAQPPTIKPTPIIEILKNPKHWEEKIVTVEGRFYGWKPPENLPGPPFHGPPVTRSDWIIADETGWIYITGKPPSTPLKQPVNQKVTITGKVETTIRNGDLTPYIQAVETEILTLP